VTIQKPILTERNLMKIKGRKIILDERDNSSPEAFDKALRKWKKSIRNLGILKEIRDRRSFEKPSVKKRKKRIESQRNNKRKK